MKVEAIAALSTWGKPSVLDRVDGRFRGEIKRNEKLLVEKFTPSLKEMLQSSTGKIQNAAITAVGKLKIEELAEDIENIFSSSTRSRTKRTALQSLSDMQHKNLVTVLRTALEDKSMAVRSEALSLIINSDIPESEAVSLFVQVLEKENSSTAELQVAMASLGSINSSESVGALSSQFDNFKNGGIHKDVILDLIDAIEKQADENLLEQLDQYYEGISDDPLAKYLATLDGGNARNGRNVFYRNEAAQCVRCHSIYEWGGDAGPGLSDVGSRLTPREILESLVAPSSQLADGYAVASFKLNDGEVIAGMIKEENAETITVETGNKEKKVVSKSIIEERTDIPSSMPDMKNILTKTEIRDLVSFLKGLRIKREAS